MGRYKHILIIIVSLAIALLASCEHIHYSTDKNLHLGFSCDTLTFDTLFSSIPSRTSTIIIYNRSKDYVNISDVYLKKGENSSFRYNFNGHIPGKDTRLSNLEIMPNDSIYIFVELTINTTEDSLPIYVEDHLMLSVNGNTDSVTLNAYGKNALIFRSHTINSDTTLTSQHPYLVFDYLHVAEGATLTIEEGAELYLHNNANIIVDGNIQCRGTLEHPIIMRGDRFDHINDVDRTPYDYMPAQWGSIYLQNAMGNHLFAHTHIRGGTMGIMLLGAPRSYPTLTIESCIIHNMSIYGLYLQEGNTTIVNSEISNCGTNCVCQLGGKLSMAHNTIANYYPWGVRNGASVVICNHIINGNRLSIYPVESSTIENSIIFGNRNNELALEPDTFTNAAFNVLVSNCLIRAEKSTSIYLSNITWSHAQNDFIVGTTQYMHDTVFVNTSISDIEETGYFDFQLAIGSRAINQGNKAVANLYPIDLLGVSRINDYAPDLGAYERTAANNQ